MDSELTELYKVYGELKITEEIISARVANVKAAIVAKLNGQTRTVESSPQKEEPQSEPKP